MKSIKMMAFFCLSLAFLIGCQPQNKPVPTPAPAPDTSKNGGVNLPASDDEMDLMSAEIIAPAVVIPDPRSTTTVLENRKDGDLMPVFITQTEEGGGQTKIVSSFSLTAESAIKAIDVLQKIGKIGKKDFACDGPPMVGKGPATYNFSRNGKAESQITVQNGAKKVDPAIAALEAFVAAEVADFKEAKSGIVGKTAAFLEGKVWQSDTDPKRRISFRNGRLVTFNEKDEEPGSVYVSMRRHCADGCGRFTKKVLAEGMKAGFICCVTLTAQDDMCFIITEAEGKKLELIGTNEGSKSETFTHLTRK